MVTKSSTGPSVDTTTAAPSAPPYPESPTIKQIPASASSVYSDDLKTSPAFSLVDRKEAQHAQRRGSDASVASNGTWDSDSTEHRNADENEDDFVEVPQPLRVRPSSQDIKSDSKQKEEGIPTALQPGGGEHRQYDVPAVLRPGPANATSQDAHGYHHGQQSNPWQSESKNPYLNQTGSVPTQDHSQRAWQQTTRPPPAQPVWQQPPPPSQEQSIWQQESAPNPAPPAQAPPVPPVETGHTAPPYPHSAATQSFELSTVQTPAEELSRMWLRDEVPASSSPTGSYMTAEVLAVPQKGQPPFSPVVAHNSSESQAFPPSNPWAGNEQLRTPSPSLPPKEALSPVPSDAAPSQPQHSPSTAGSMIDHGQPQTPPMSTTAPPTQPATTSAEPPAVRNERQRNEHYQIKHINWLDTSSDGQGGYRKSPVLTQTANGPCPLLALVNALVLSTPRDLETALITTLRSREQVSLGLLLDAVFDELTSDRRGDTAQALPDVSDLYAFLLALHTGMNVNPRFVTSAVTPRGSLEGYPPETQGVHPTLRSQSKAGSFEETREMRLYSTFGIPLIHGWTAPKDTPVFLAFQRSAPTFEDAQNIQFMEAELEDKLRQEGLSFQEQQTLEDIATIKSFLQTWPTQLTDHGLEMIAGCLKPGQIAILFRNDHFSTIYKEPQHGALMTLVTDAGYSSHEEIVWESLVDVSGAACEMFSGDFQSLSHGAGGDQNQQSSAQGSGEGQWQAAQDRYHAGNAQTQSSGSTAQVSEDVPPPLPGPRPTAPQASGNQTTEQRQLSASEQEDHDLALAMQLQEEEEDQQRQADARRRQERILSEQYLSNEEAQERAPAVPPRRQSGQRASQTSRPSGRPAVNRPGADADPDAPPTYEQSRTDRPYRPAGTTAAPSQGNPLETLDALQHRSQYSQVTGTLGGGSPGQGRRVSGNRISRRQSGMGGPGFGAMPAQGGGSHAPAYAAAGPSSGRVQGAANVKDTDDKCVVM
ncbi:unnamed protein product [Zymoseptoria tritici ST99CH_1A5]|uniref:MINDY deubiquitinase domain-containing protein n=1 Tax=Zymoseptoria tritici ST99CH_1A5 TaxID=1276529 RepID=A0A1Y6LVF3_ZYMTR|nr:unnamed protein product [Zymoseptoria tritici ST99CH_1A5]